MYSLRNFYPRSRLSYVFWQRFLVVAGYVIFQFWNSREEEVWNIYRFEGVHRIICSHQVKTYISLLDGIEIVWCFFHDMFSSGACVDNGFIVCVIGSVVSADGFSWSVIWVNTVTWSKWQIAVTTMLFCFFFSFWNMFFRLIKVTRLWCESSFLVLC